ncbi:hypothetical protein BJY00DRAFT_21322 [Aspergillus carlsbadensis]|nr:hypothetical protein BJY00DRAFT_21322 [Aspergillus carlsbadensis]
MAVLAMQVLWLPPLPLEAYAKESSTVSSPLLQLPSRPASCCCTAATLPLVPCPGRLVASRLQAHTRPLRAWHYSVRSALCDGNCWSERIITAGGREICLLHALRSLLLLHHLISTVRLDGYPISRKSMAVTIKTRQLDPL